MTIPSRFDAEGTSLSSRIGQNRNGATARVSDPMRLSLGLLLKAHKYAHDVGHGVWDFAVAIQRLRATGLSECDMRWLGCKRYVEHALEMTLPGEAQRSFRPLGKLTFLDRSCFVLSNDGVRFSEQVARAAASSTWVGDGLNNIEQPSGSEGSKWTHPHWDPNERVLWVGEAVVKRFRVPASNQEVVLSVFEEEGWPKHIDDPLSPAPEMDPKRRLHSTIHCLNRNQKRHLIHFHGDGHGTGLCWELLSTE